MACTSIFNDRGSVLVVEDDPFAQDVMCSMLRAEGFSRIVVTNNGREALDKLADASEVPDYLISDLFMPDTDGFEPISGLASTHYTGSLILLSGISAEMLSVASALASGLGLDVRGALVKPLHRDTLTRLLAH